MFSFCWTICCCRGQLARSSPIKHTCLPLGLRSMPSTKKGPFLRAISCSMMPKLYTSPFWVPWGGCRSYMSSSGAVQSFSRGNIRIKNVLHVFYERCDWINDLQHELTCIERVRVVVFAGRAEAGQAVIRYFQNKPAVHHAIRWLQISVAAKVAVVQEVHTLVQRSVRTSINGRL